MYQGLDGRKPKGTGEKMHWLNDLIWVGNTLYPRWFVFGVPAVAILCLIALSAAVSYWRA